MNSLNEYYIFESCLWAKKNNSDGKMLWLPLKQHLSDAMNIAGLLWEHWLSRGQKNTLISSTEIEDEEVIKRTLMFIAAIHDLGKATPAFQIKPCNFSSSSDLDIEIFEKLERAGFNGISNLRLLDSVKSHHALASEAILRESGINSTICSVVGAHHGKPVDGLLTVEKQINSYEANYYQKENIDDAVYLKWKYTQKYIIEWALEQTGFEDSADLPVIDEITQVTFLGLLVMSDWIASNEIFFPLVNSDCAISEIDQESRLREGWNKWYKTNNWEPQFIEDIEEFYYKRFGFHPREIQRKLSLAISKTETPGIFIIEAPMGMGKTESALAASELLCEKTGRSGIFFGLPTQATSDGIFPRIKNWLQSISAEADENHGLQLIHGKAALNDEFRSISKNIDDDGSGSVTVNEWFTGKKTSVLEEFVVGTIDQFLLMTLKQKHLSLRHLGLSKKIIIIDEVHAYDAYMGQYLYQAIRWMGAYNVPVIILSATLPAGRRVELINSYLKGQGWKKNEIESVEAWEKNHAYPIITYTDKNRILQENKIEITEKKYIRTEKIDDEELLQTLSDSIADGGVAGIIVNTVKRAQELTKNLVEKFGDENVLLLHSAFLSPERINKEKELIGIIGKGAERPYKKIIVGTQVIEQSLDIDFDVMFTDLSPADLILQRTGRLHRHADVRRPEKLKEPILYIMGTDEEFNFNSGSSAVYGDYHLIRTQIFLPEIIKMPEDISLLVQRVYGDEELSLNDFLGEKYIAARKEMDEKLRIKKEKAKSFLLGNPSNPKNSEPKPLYGWLSNISPVESDERGNAQVRDSEPSLEVILVQKQGNGYGFVGKEEDISEKISSTEVSKKLSLETIRLPHALTPVWNISGIIDELEKENIRLFPQWQKQQWLRGSLGIMLDENGYCKMGKWKLHYSTKYGLEYEKEEE